MTDRVHQLVEPSLSAQGLELVDVEHRAGVLRVTVEREGGIDLDHLSEASGLVSEILDRADPVPGRYLLEVSSPGVERPLRTPAHFRRAVGSTVAVRTRPHVEGDRRVQGVLEAADDEGIVVGDRRLRHDEVERAHTVFEWGPAPRARSGRGKGRRARAS